MQLNYTENFDLFTIYDTDIFYNKPQIQTLMSEEVKHEAQVAEVDKMIAGKTVISFNLPTPKWVTWIFRTEFVLNKAVLIYLAGTSSISKDNIQEYVLILSIVDFVVWGMGRGIGIKKDDFENGG